MEVFEPKNVDTYLKNKIADLAIKYFADKDEIDITKFNVEVLKVNDINYKEYITAGKAGLKRFLMLFPEIFIIEEKNYNGGTQCYCRIREDARRSIRDILVEMVKKNGGKMLLSTIGPTLVREYQIDYKQHSGGKGLSVWLKAEHSDIFELDGIYCVLKDPIHMTIVEILTTLIRLNGGKFFLAEVGPKLLAEYGINYKEYSGGRTLQSWLKNEFSNEFVIDGYNILLAQDTGSALTELKGEVAQMHAVAFMSWKLNNAKLLQKYTGQTLSVEEWSNIVARGFAYAILGETPLFSYETDAGIKLVFNTGVKTVKGNSLFCVLKQNPHNTSGNLQPYAIEDFCCVVEEDNDLSNEIKQNVPDVLKSDNVLDKKYEELGKDLEVIIRQKEKLESLIPEISRKIADGTAIDADIFVPIKAYYDKWNHAKDIIEYLGWDTDDGVELSISSLAGRLEYTNKKSDVLNRAVDLFVNFAKAISSHSKNNFCNEMSNIVNQDIEIAKKASLEQYNEFKELLVYYVRLMNITEYDTENNTIGLTELAESILFINNHFKSLSSMDIFKLAFYKKTAEELAISSKSIPCDVLELLSQLDMIASDEEEEKEPVAVDCDELLVEVVYNQSVESLAGRLLSVGGFYESKLEKAIALGDYDRCKGLVSNAMEWEEYQKTPEELQKAIDQLAEESPVLTLYECGMRLQKVIGNCNRTAEKFFIAGLTTNPCECSRALIEVYISENDMDNFYIVWSKYGQNMKLSNENLKFLLYTLATKGEAVLEEYLAKNIYIFYDVSTSAMLQEVSGEFGFTKLLEKATTRFEHIASIADDGEAEKLAWKALAEGFDEEKCLELLGMLMDAERYSEVCELFECYQDKFTKLPVAREIYIKVLIKTGNQRAYSFIRDNMQDFLNLYVRGDLSEDDLISHGEPCEASLLWENIGDVLRYLDDTVIASIIGITDDLRDFAVNTVKLADFGLNTEQVENFVSVYKTDSFPRERDILSLAKRLYLFIGSHNATKDFALFALKCGFDALELLWEIYTQANDVDAKYQLLSENPEFEVGKEREYCAILMQKGEYEKFLTEAQKLDYDSAELAVQMIIAKCHLGGSFDQELEYLENGISGIGFELLSQMIFAMADMPKSSYIEAFIAEHFDQMLSLYSAEELEILVTAGGRLGEDSLKKIQKTANARDSKKLVMYIYEIFGLGRQKGASGKFIEEALAQYMEDGDEGSTLAHLRVIYAKNQEFVNKIILCEITKILSFEDSIQKMCEKIEQAIEDRALSAGGISQLMNLINERELPITPKIYNSIIFMCRDREITKECLDFINSTERFYSLENDIDVLGVLCRMYKDAAKDKTFEENWLGGAIKTCAKLVDTDYFYEAVYCMYQVQMLFENYELAKFNLLELLDKKHEAPAELLEEIEAEAEKMQIGDDTDIFSLFVEMADKSDIAAIEEYCAYCGNFVRDNKALADYYRENFSDTNVDSYSAESCQVLLKLLYINPKEGEFWYQCANMPLEEHPEVYAKLLYKASLLNNKESMWKKCIDACERYSQEDLLMDVLIDCATYIPMPYGLQNLRSILAEKVNTNPLYFSTLDNDRLAELISIICKRMEKDPGVRGNHNALRDLSAIAISTNSKEAYSIMMDYAEEYIFGENHNIGFAIACRLLLAKRLSEAKEIIERLTSIASAKFKKLISKLAVMNMEELTCWSSEEVNVQLLNMLLPDGNYPNIPQLNDFALSHISNGKAEMGAMLICELLDNMPSDYGISMALFLLCKQVPDRLDLLHKALCGLVENEPKGKTKSYYTRTRKEFALSLANVDAIIISQKINHQITAFDGYDFTKPTWEFYQKCEGHIDNVSDFKEIQQAYENIQNALTNRSQESREIIYKLVFGYVTGNWSEFIKMCWAKQENMSSYLEYYSSFDTGLTRSILNVAYSLPGGEQEEFIDWVNNNKTADCSKQIATAVNLFKKEYYTKIPHDIFEGNILELPFEENCVFDPVFRNTVYQLISKAPTAVQPCAMLVGYLACSNNAMSEFWKHAMIAFEAQNDTVANKLFAVMNEINRKEHVYHGYINNSYKPGEMYESMMRVTGVFAENESIISAISKQTFNPWSCINMVFALLYTKRANEVSRLRQYFAEDHQRLTDVILVIINKKISDIDKLDAVRTISNEISRGIIYYILRYWDTTNRQTVFLSEEDSVMMATEALERIAADNPGSFSAKLQPTHFIWVEPSRINENAYIQLKTNVEKTNYEVVDVSTIEEEAEDAKLSFVAMLEPITESERTIEALWEEHEGIRSYGMENYQQRVAISKEIYQIALGQGAEDALLKDYAIRYGVDYYYYCMGSKEYSKANSIVIEMVKAFDSSSLMDGARMLKSTICNTALHELLHRGYSTIRSMVEDYIENKQAFIKMRNMLPASTMYIELNDVNCIYAALETIARCIKVTSDSHTSALRRALAKAGNQLNELESQGYQGWGNIRHSILQMIRDEINRLDQRAIMVVDIINKLSHSPSGFIYGQVKNMGNEVAENITIQFIYDNNFRSDIYELPKLGKGEAAAFEVNYSSAPGTERLKYEMVVSYYSKGERYDNTSSDSLTIQEREFEEFPTGLYGTDRPIMTFSLLEDGSVYSREFYGREEEKKKINAIFAGNGFVNYKNILVKGIRRAGKTSVLNYLLNYANLKCDDVVAVYVDCSGAKANNAPIQRTLVDSVIKECTVMNVGNASLAEWSDFAKKWSLPADQTDCDVDNLRYFYRELKALNGNRGLMLIIDEFDILIEEVEKNQGVYSTLLPSLRVLLNNPYCQDAIHLVVCGSTKLIRYMDGGTLNQFFQQFGDNVIEIGKLLEKEMEIMLTDPYREYPEVKIDPLALSWIWKFTSGLVWYSKLIAGCALIRACMQERNIVYPSDIVDAVTTVASNEEYFRNLKESCNPAEIQVLDAIQCLTAKATEYVSISDILELLSGEFCQRDIENIAITLERMQILERNPFDKYSYRFAVELYWHYFRVSPSNRARREEIPVIFKVRQNLQPSKYSADRFDK